MNEATREVVALSASVLQRNRVVRHFERAEDLPNVAADRIQIQQVILNLLLKASDAMIDVHERPRQWLIRTDREHGDRVRPRPTKYWARPSRVPFRATRKR